MEDLVAVGAWNLESGEDDLGVFVLVDLIDVLGDGSFFEHTAGADDDASAFSLEEFFDLFGFADSLEEFGVGKISVNAMRIVSDVLFGESGGEGRMTIDLFSFSELEFTFMSRVYERADDLLKSLESETWHECH